MKRKLKYIALWLAFVAGVYYFVLPPINVQSQMFWSFLLFAMIIPGMVLSLAYKATNVVQVLTKKIDIKADGKSFTGILAIMGIGCMAVLVLGSFAGAKILHASEYASILKIEERDFSEDIDESQVLDKVALMDTQSAKILGDRKIGSLSDVVSQYNVSNQYSQIDYKGFPLKVAALEYADFFKYLGNNKNGVPGYIMVDPVEQTTEYVEVARGMKYIPSSYLQKDLARHMQFAYPTAILSNLHFEINEEGEPFYVASVMDYTIGLFGGETVKGVVVCDPCSGETQYYALKEIPNWVDMAFSGNLLVEQFDWYGQLSNGYLNSLFAKKGCKKSTQTRQVDETSEGNYVEAPDYGYIAKDGDIWIYTGVTSVNEDSSNIGFIMVNERTGEARYFAVAGADESSAMAAAEGEVQEKRYEASFPSLINVDGNATYIMVLKDSNGIAKMYAMVNVEQYNLVATGDTMKECFKEYRRILGIEETQEDGANNATNQEEYDGDREEITFVVSVIQYIDVDGNTFVYMGDESGRIFFQEFQDNPDLLFVKVGDTMTALCVKTDTNKYAIVQE